MNLWIFFYRKCIESPKMSLKAFIKAFFTRLKININSYLKLYRNGNNLAIFNFYEGLPKSYEKHI